MSIPTEREPDPEPPFERCCFCRVRTTTRTKLTNRNPAAQVACCEGCAAMNVPEAVPTKRAWFEKERQLDPRPWMTR